MSENDRGFDWCPHLQMVFNAMELHAGLRTFVVRNYPPEDIDYSWLERLLSRNRNITVLDERGNRITNGTTIDKLYALNRYFHESAKLVKDGGNGVGRERVGEVSAYSIIACKPH